MIRQYYAQRCQGGDNPLRVGTIAIGSIYYIQPTCWWRDRFRGKAECREPWIVEGFFNGLMGAAIKDPLTGYWENRYVSRRSDTALIRSLRTGRRRTTLVHTLILHDDEGLTKGPTHYPDLPRLPFRKPKSLSSKKETSPCLELTTA
ncbi:hypothetical protein [Beijerinckia indica]|uniref:Uncharacterized protein n=1 Tax=Beijerinckia indica subsp. indica (strain ATCC 9039 / DSM 1715 / NCIMB 8712) TaxID=395963 RepID=B2IL79_BEII9|nr:hypothetical protein [Beijerinckia indica]ACB97279.1 hypothetical protein Bind_3727 [Beijerinckia indica subsp. indica ATCC 9039]